MFSWGEDKMAIRCSASCIQRKPKIKLKGVKLDAAQKKVRYATYKRKLYNHSDSYIPAYAVKEKELSETDVARLEILLNESRWAQIPVADPEDEKFVSRPRSFSYTYLEKEIERFTAHILGPGGSGSHYNEKWQEISDIVLGKKK